MGKKTISFLIRAFMIYFAIAFADYLAQRFFNNNSWIQFGFIIIFLFIIELIEIFIQNNLKIQNIWELKGFSIIKKFGTKIKKRSRNDE